MLRKLTECVECTGMSKAYRGTYLRTPKSRYTGNIAHPYLKSLLCHKYRLMVHIVNNNRKNIYEILLNAMFLQC